MLLQNLIRRMLASMKGKQNASLMISFYVASLVIDLKKKRHFSQTDHLGLKNMEIHVLEFIKAPPKSPQGATIRKTIERNWTHLLRTLAPQGLNMENPKEFKTSKGLKSTTGP